MGKDEETGIVNQGLTLDIWKQMKLNCGAQRHHYSMFNVDGLVKSPKKANFQISHLIISIGYASGI